MKSQFLAALLMMGLCFVLSCSNNNNGSQLNPISNQDVTNMAAYFQGQSQAEMQNVSQGTALVSGTSTSMAFSVLGDTVTSDTSCVTVATSTSGSTKTVLFTFSCASITGTVQVSSTQGSTDSYEIVTKVGLIDPSNNQYTASVNSDNIITLASGTYVIAATFDDIFSNGTDTYELKGTTNDSITPINPAQLLGGGSLTLNTSLQIIKDNNNIGTITLSSSGLQYAACGLDAGTVTLAANGQIYSNTFSACSKALNLRKKL